MDDIDILQSKIKNLSKANGVMAEEIQDIQFAKVSNNIYSNDMDLSDEEVHDKSSLNKQIDNSYISEIVSTQASMRKIPRR